MLIIKYDVFLRQTLVTLADFGYPVGFIGPLVYCSQTLSNYLAFQYFDIERT
jgi:hypothetical protein